MTSPFGRCRRFGAATDSVQGRGMLDAGKLHPRSPGKLIGQWALGATVALRCGSACLGSSVAVANGVWRGNLGSLWELPRSLRLGSTSQPPARGSKLAQGACAAGMGVLHMGALFFLPLARENRQNHLLPVENCVTRPALNIEPTSQLLFLPTGRALFCS